MYMDNNKIIWVDNIYKVLRCFIACFDNLLENKNDLVEFLELRIYNLNN